jgi:hypothetical protein
MTGSTGVPNTGPIFYLSEATIATSCKKEHDNVETECATNKASSRASARAASLENKQVSHATPLIKDELATLEALQKTAYGYQATAGKNAWIDDHCHGLWLKPMNVSGFSVFTDIVQGIKTGLLNGIAAGTSKAAEVAPHLGELERMLSDDKKDKTKITRSTVLAEMMSAAASGNPCIQARRCILLPYKETEAGSVDGKKMAAGEAQATTGKGCCPGQTGHHILPGAMFQPGNGTKACGEDYNHNEAPVMCVEGMGNRVGTHGVAHLALDKTIETYKKNNPGKAMSYADARAHGIKAAREVNPACSEDCLRAQLDAHYADKLKCGDAKLKPHSGMKEKKAQTSGTTAAPSMPSAGTQ